MPRRAPHIFIADDQRDVLEALRLLLKGEGYSSETFTDPNALVQGLRARKADAVLMDLNYTRDTTSGEEGLDLIGRIRAFDAFTPVVVMTAWGSIELAVEAMRRGAQDFVEKPWDNARLLTVLRTQVALGQALNRARALEAENRELTAADQEMIAESPVMQPVLETIERVAPSDANVLITGESGTGKGLIARLIHARSPRRDRSLVIVNIGSLSETVFESEMFGHVKGAFTDAKADRVGRFELADGGTLFLDEIANIPVAQALHAVSPRASKPLVTVNAGGLSEGVFESELFGHVKGAFTDAKADRVGRFELADGGTLFLDEIANISPGLQAKLLRVLETGEFERVGSSRTRRVNVRILSATNADLHEEVAAGRFRQDLLFRLNTIEIQLPPVRERREDVPLLARHFLAQHAQRYRKRISGFDAGAMQLLLDHAWPGNVRELDHAVERAVLMAQGSQIQPRDLGLRSSRDAAPRIEDMSLEDVEGFLIRKALARFGGNVSQAAKALGLSRSALYRRLQRFGL
ncbi:MAG TPA: sigma 54-interacting transcriptional regulator [Gammaproteobacteria bacterium]